MNDLMSVIAPLMLICMLGMGVAGIAFLHGYFVTGEVDGIPAGTDMLIGGILCTAIGLVGFGLLAFFCVASVAIWIQRRKDNK